MLVAVFNKRQFINNWSKELKELQELPLEILVHISSYLTDVKTISAFRRTCSYFNEYLKYKTIKLTSRVSVKLNFILSFTNLKNIDIVLDIYEIKDLEVLSTLYDKYEKITLNLFISIWHFYQHYDAGYKKYKYKLIKISTDGQTRWLKKGLYGLYNATMLGDIDFYFLFSLKPKLFI